MDDKAIMMNIFKKAWNVQLCQRKQCKAQLSEAMRNGEQLKNEMVRLMKSLIDKNISREEYIKRLDKLKANHMKSKQTLDLIQCTLKNCNAQVKEVLDSMGKLKQNTCSKTNKTACKDAEHIKKVIKKKEISLPDYKKILKI